MVSAWASVLQSGSPLLWAAHAAAKTARHEGRAILADPTGRARIALGMLAILIAAGFGLLVIVLVGRYLRRMVRKPLAPAHPQDDPWYAKRLAPGESAGDKRSEQDEP